MELGSDALYASAKLIAPDCGTLNAAFAACKQESPDPASCLTAGAAVRSCVERVAGVAQSQCAEPFAAYKTCLADADRDYGKCRAQERALKVCYYRATRLAPRVEPPLGIASASASAPDATTAAAGH